MTDFQQSSRKWMSIALFNLMLVAILGVIMRYKIAYSLPFVEQKYVLHAHSHFAFGGWITQALMSLMVASISKQVNKNYFKKYRFILIANLVTSYGMLVSFIYQGYALFSIIFSTLSIFAGY